jgi:hypothetical protein
MFLKAAFMQFRNFTKGGFKAAFMPSAADQQIYRRNISFVHLKIT